MDIFDSTFESLYLHYEMYSPDKPMFDASVFEDMSSMLGKMGYIPMAPIGKCVAFAEIQNEDVKIREGFNKQQFMDFSTDLELNLRRSLRNGDDIVYISFDSSILEECRFTSVELDDDFKIVSSIFEEGEVIETYEWESNENLDNADLIHDTFPNDYAFIDGTVLIPDPLTKGVDPDLFTTEKEASYELALNALGIRTSTEFVLNEGYVEKFILSFPTKIQFWFSNSMFILKPFNCAIPSEFIKNLREANAKV